MSEAKVRPLRLDTYIAVIRNSVGADMFRNFYAVAGGKRMDIMRDGDLSCAFYASFVMSALSLISEVHGTVGGTVRDMEASGWKRIRKPKPGCVIVWAAKIDDHGESHRHIGFYIGDGKAVSNSSRKGSPQRHRWDNRKVEALYWRAGLK